jgi:hypothetical protein
MKSFLLIITAVCLMAGCKKPLLDYRYKYVGTYEVTSYNSSYMMGQPQNFDTVYYSLKVRRSNDMYSVDFIQDNQESTYLIEKEGTLHFYSYDWHYHVSGEFTDKNHFHISGGYFGLGGGNSFDAYGVKK